jgi:hypothetical protein
MPWISRSDRKRSRGRLRGLRRWRYDHSQDVTAFWIGLGVVAAAIVVLAMMRAAMT